MVKAAHARRPAKKYELLDQSNERPAMNDNHIYKPSKKLRLHTSQRKHAFSLA